MLGSTHWWAAVLTNGPESVLSLIRNPKRRTDSSSRSPCKIKFINIYVYTHTDTDTSSTEHRELFREGKSAIL